MRRERRLNLWVGESSGPRLPRALKAGAAAAVLVGLLSVVALAARGSHPGARYGAHQREVPARVGNDLLTFAIVVYGAGLLILVAAFLTFRHKWVEPRSRWLRDFFVTLTVCCFLALIGYRLFHNHNALRRTGQPHTPGLTGALQQTDTQKQLPQLKAPRKSAHFDARFAAVLGGLALLTAAAFLVRGRRVSPPVEPELEEDLREVVSDTIDDLRRETDPRRAVIAAYARMEAVLGRHGRARRAAEAPYEYLERVLGELRVGPAAIGDLTELFERAKFSVHRIDTAMKDRAIDALLTVRDDLGRT